MINFRGILDMFSDIFSITDQINTVNESNRHVVILGAGASKASCLDRGEKNGKKLPLMDDLSSVIGLENELKDLPKELQNHNFEKVFSSLYREEMNSQRIQDIEKKIYHFFDGLLLPDEPTIYDYLVLSLRKKDLIATFNWDPFLIQAYVRNSRFTNNLPLLSFLHGNVAIGVDLESKTVGVKGGYSSKSGQPLQSVKLLYPIENKNYSDDTLISEQWSILTQYLKNPARVTIFGYSAPTSDTEAVGLMKNAWGNTETNQQFTQFEIIDTKTECELLYTWKDFIHTHHYEVTNDFFNSSIVRFPRRSGEVYFANYIQAMYYEENSPPRFQTLEDMWKWYQILVDNEN
jgi:hypothetical protein